MAGGGTAEAMKVSDVFILVGISVLVAGFVMHAWVDSEVLASEDGETAVLEKSAMLMKNDKLLIDLDIETANFVEVTVYAGLEEYQLVPVGDIDDYEFEFTAKEGGQHLVIVEVGASDGVVEGEVLIDVQRSLMLDFMVYPLGALILAFGIYKKKEEKSVEPIDAELN
tara:strand:- start:4775 stop:5278 length:504 start_codon:yes stop_codon:yes gene_type:complete